MHIDNYVASPCSWRWRPQQPTAGTAAATTASCRTVAHVEYVASSMALTTTRKFDSFNVLPHTSMRALAPTQQHISSPMLFIQSLCTWRTLFNSIPKYSSVSMYTSSPPCTFFSCCCIGSVLLRLFWIAPMLFRCFLCVLRSSLCISDLAFVHFLECLSVLAFKLIKFTHRKTANTPFQPKNFVYVQLHTPQLCCQTISAVVEGAGVVLNVFGLLGSV